MKRVKSAVVTAARPRVGATVKLKQHTGYDSLSTWKVTKVRPDGSLELSQHGYANPRVTKLEEIEKIVKSSVSSSVQLRSSSSIVTAATVDEVVKYLKQAGIIPEGSSGFKALGPDETWTKLHQDKMVKAVRRSLGSRATAKTVDEVVQYLKQAGILPDSAKGFKSMGPDATWDRLDNDPLAASAKTRRDVIATLIQSGRPDLANEFVATTADKVSAGNPSGQVASYLNGMVNQIREHLRTVGGQMSYYINGAGHEQLDDNQRRLMDKAKRKLDAWEKQQVKTLADIANDVKKIA